jgi:hypothetical protein
MDDEPPLSYWEAELAQREAEAAGHPQPVNRWLSSAEQKIMHKALRRSAQPLSSADAVTTASHQTDK